MATMSRRDVLKLTATGAVLASTGLTPTAAGTKDGMETFDIALEGGGIKGVAFIGAVAALREAGHRFRCLIGSSAGAIAATCLAAGFDTDKLQERLTERTAKGRHRFSAFLAPPT